MTTIIMAKQLKIARFFTLVFMFTAMFTNHFLDFIGFFIISMVIVLKEIQMEKENKKVTTNEVNTTNNNAKENVNAMPHRNTDNGRAATPIFKPTKVTQNSVHNVNDKENMPTRS